MTTPVVHKLTSSPTPEDYHLPAEKLIRGNPKQTVWSHYTDASGQFSVGLWRSEPGAWRVRYTEEEYCRMLEGKSILTSEAGAVLTLVAGDEFVVPRGFVGTWEVVETTTKRFVIYEKQA
jgi:uncharacterized cupin superfamily protein